LKKLQYRIDDEKFALELNLRVFESDIAYTSNTIMKMTVESYDFKGIAELDIDIKEFARFSADLKKIYETLNGTARIEEPYGNHQFIEFTGDGRGHISVYGYILQRTGICDNELKFSSEIDQTQMKNFAEELYENYFKYCGA